MELVLSCMPFVASSNPALPRVVVAGQRPCGVAWDADPSTVTVAVYQKLQRLPPLKQRRSPPLKQRAAAGGPSQPSAARRRRGPGGPVGLGEPRPVRASRELEGGPGRSIVQPRLGSISEQGRRLLRAAPGPAESSPGPPRTRTDARPGRRRGGSLPAGRPAGEKRRAGAAKSGVGKRWASPGPAK